MIKKIFAISVFCLIFFNFIPTPNLVWGLTSVEAEADLVEIDFFYSKTCPHCARENKFLDELEEEHSQIKINRRAISKKENIELLKKFYKDYKVSQDVYGWVPVTFIEDSYFIGFNDKVEKEIKECILGLVGQSPGESETCPEELTEADVITPIDIRQKVKIPFIGEINLADSSPMALAIILGGLDGFNACAMVALGFLLAVLAGTGIRKRVFLIGGTFIFVSGFVYFLFISAWLNLFMVLSNVKIITYAVGAIIALLAALLLKDYFAGVICKLCNVDSSKEGIFTKLQRKLFGQMQNVITSKISLPLILLAVAAVAAGVNLVELVCSFGFPLAFTKILTNLQLSTPTYYFYLLVYIGFYMLDDFIIFCVAVWTLRVTGVSQKYLKTIKLISGIFLMALGLIMLLRPELLMFG